MTAQHLLYKMTWEETRAAVDKRLVVVIPVAAIEQHGPHLPVDVDNLLTVTLCEEAARRHPDILACAMHIPYGYNAHNMAFPGTVSIRQQVFVDYCFDVCASYAAHGFKYILLINGHGSNVHLCEGIARRVSMETSARCGQFIWPQLVPDVIADFRESVYPGGTGHACEVETSLYLAIDPDSVQQEKAPKEITWNVGEYWYKDFAGGGPLSYTSHHHEFSRTGVAGDPTVATAEKGRLMLEAFCERLPKLAEEFRTIVDQPRYRDLPTDRSN
ncbi:MAG: creatinine amidohydrolase [Thermomicrobiales bacterium]|jgi:creatinine amidohydrolase|nr:creatinine amidohydrolase [Thermomicrobiales bacterium]MEA2526781.1 creatinine amidohydrolase [Thermomicrobiales bacterium]MEA2531983.1 creatinine amidohydrolase [Thermomicrobiales bacterium]MEA2585100.1 creatinine amidohydrolase [Thermomicrobiales bacterium]